MSNDIQMDEFNEVSFWQKVKTVAMKAGKKVIHQSLKLYYCLLDDDTPAWAKTVIIAALAYFITPIDAVIDIIPGGYVDDLGALITAAATVAAHIKDVHVAQADQVMQNWFVDDLPDEPEATPKDANDIPVNNPDRFIQ